MLTLIAELANEQKPAVSRQAAGLRLKNIFESRNAEVKQQLAMQWKGIPPEVKNQIKQQVLATLHSASKDARRTSAQLLSTLTIIELHNNQWLDVIQQLVMNTTNKIQTEFGVEASLTALGYICEESVCL